RLRSRSRTRPRTRLLPRLGTRGPRPAGQSRPPLVAREFNVRLRVHGFARRGALVALTAAIAGSFLVSMPTVAAQPPGNSGGIGGHRQRLLDGGPRLPDVRGGAGKAAHVRPPWPREVRLVPDDGRIHHRPARRRELGDLRPQPVLAELLLRLAVDIEPDPRRL